MSSRYTATITEIQSDDYGSEWEGIPYVRAKDLNDRQSAVVVEVANDFDGATCPSCIAQEHTKPSLIGWFLEESEWGGPAGVRFMEFFVVDNGRKAWPVCEDCTFVLDPPYEDDEITNRYTYTAASEIDIKN